jgi:ferric-dicitrate binding protein FerR (iron transport regulator)
MTDKEFAELIKRFLAGQSAKEEAVLIEAWLNGRSQEDHFGKLSGQEKEKIRARSRMAFSAAMIGSGEEVAKKSPAFSRVKLFRVAAAIILLCVLSYTVRQLPVADDTKTKVIKYASGVGNNKVMLSDGTLVWLKGPSSIMVPEKFTGNERNVTLTGEALFEVSKDVHRPFIIQCGGLRAEVLGTSFNIKSSSTEVEVFVLTGKVALSSEGSNRLIVLSNEKAVYHSAQNEIAKVLVNKGEKSAKTAGTEYSMLFYATRMKEIVERIEGKFAVRIVLRDERLNNCTITADLTDQSLNRTLDLISQSLKIEYEINHGEVLLKGEGCD